LLTAGAPRIAASSTSRDRLHSGASLAPRVAPRVFLAPAAEPTLRRGQFADRVGAYVGPSSGGKACPLANSCATTKGRIGPCERPC
jgi:hypothetical protein